MTCRSVACAAFALACTTGCVAEPVPAVTAHGARPAASAPLAPLDEVPGEPPAPGMVWMRGCWHWDGSGYVWLPGHWMSDASDVAGRAL